MYEMTSIVIVFEGENMPDKNTRSILSFGRVGFQSEHSPAQACPVRKTAYGEPYSNIYQMMKHIPKLKIKKQMVATRHST